MASKRPSHQEGNNERDQAPSKRRQGDSEEAETRTPAMNNKMKEQGTNDIVLYLEPLLRQLIREEVPPMLQRYLSPCCGLTLNRQTGKSGGRALQLRFKNKLPPTIFTLSKIIAEDGAPLQIELCNATCIVNEGPLSSMRIEVCVLNGEFGSNGSEDWTAEEFNAKTLSPREGKGPLLKGDRFITLENGVGFIPKNVFTDNSRWTRSGTFRLGVKIVQPTSIEADIREGRSEPFSVKDNRGEPYKKHDRPSLNDEIWRLKMIRKDGKIHKQLSSHGIKTVKDLLQLYITNQTSLREKIGNIPRKKWDTVIEHAKACVIDDGKRYIYPYCTSEQSIALVFNCIYRVVEVTFNGQNYRSLESLNLEEKRLVERVKQEAYKNLEDLIPLETLAGVQVGQWGAPDQGPQQFGFPIAQQGQQETWPCLCQPSTSTSQFGEAAYNEQIGTDQLPGLGEMPLNMSAGGEFISGGYIDGNGWPVSGSQIQFASYFSPPMPWEQVNPFYLPCGDGAESSNHSSFPNSAVYISSKGKRKTVWNKIRTALKWVILHAAKRKAKLFHCQY